jgi:hypothetical protein
MSKKCTTCGDSLWDDECIACLTTIRDLAHDVVQIAVEGRAAARVDGGWHRWESANRQRMNLALDRLAEAFDPSLKETEQQCIPTK